MGKQDIAAQVKKLTGGRGADVVYDSVGRDTWDTSIDCLKPHGLMVSFGSATGIPKPVDLHPLLGKGASFITRTSVNNYLLTREDTLVAARAIPPDRQRHAEGPHQLDLSVHGGGCDPHAHRCRGTSAHRFSRHGAVGGTAQSRGRLE
ncbi:MAG: zinc-binding dehydrogenase [Alphaproteobacteria bacterium]|nr:zinc-binding dehydrogenase [Alphaproteobacteria bacterium]